MGVVEPRPAGDPSMLAPAVVLAAVLMQAASGAGKTAGPWILACDVATSGATDAPHRTFRLGPQLFQEWKPDERRFGPNLCLSFKCSADRDRLEGTLSSNSLILTIQMDPARKAASWRTVGASGLSRTTGPCSIAPDTGQMEKGR
jgi:hypothetical protein